MFGGGSDASIRRTVRYGQGWTMGGGTPDQAGEFAARVRQAWHDGGREGEPRIAALAYFSLGDDAEQDSRAYLNDYYAFLGPYAGMIADGALRSPDAIRGAVKAFEAAGVTELYLDPTVARLDQLERLAEVVLTGSAASAVGVEPDRGVAGLAVHEHQVAQVVDGHQPPAAQ